MQMECEACGQRSDWIGEGSDWSPVGDGGVVVMQLYECERCGNRQRVR